MTQTYSAPFRVVRRVYGLGISWDCIPVVSDEVSAAYVPWPKPHSQVTRVERCRLVAVVRVTLLCVMIRVSIPLWECPKPDDITIL